VGRDELLTELYTDFAKERKVLVLHGQGGIGKTSLAVKLMEVCGINASCETLPISCPYDNAFYCQVNDSATFDLATEFLRVFGIAVDLDSANPDQIIEMILTRLHQERWLVVIDNLESLMKENSAKTKSPEVGNLLNRLAYGGHNSQIIITSRKLPEDLADRRGTRIDFSVIRAENIKGISDLNSIQLLKFLGAKDSQHDLEWIVERVCGNIFVLKLLADYSRKKPGILRKKPELVTREAKPIVLAQWEEQGSQSQDLLQRMCILRIGMNASALTIFRLLQPDGGKIEFTSEAEEATEKLLAGLVNCDLVQETYDDCACENLYVLHRLMAETLQAIFEEDLEQLWRYAAKIYGSFDLPKDENYHSLEDLRFTLEEFHFYWLLRANQENLIEKVITNILPKLKKWGYWDLEEEWLNRTLQIKIELDDRAGIAATWTSLGGIARNRGDYNKAEQFYKQSLELHTELEDRVGMAANWASLGNISRNWGDYNKAEQFYRQCLEIEIELDDRAGMASSWGVLGDITRNQGDYNKAEQFYKQSLELFTELEDRAGMATIWGCLGENDLLQGSLESAKVWLTRSLTVMEDLQMRYGIAETNWDLAQLYRSKGNEKKAQAYYTVAQRLFTELGAKKDLEKIERAWTHNNLANLTNQGQSDIAIAVQSAIDRFTEF
jgi:tetratricopeptide (TPR) repeat protein